jgi:type II secretion system protein C
VLLPYPPAPEPTPVLRAPWPTTLDPIRLEALLGLILPARPVDFSPAPAWRLQGTLSGPTPLAAVSEGSRTVTVGVDDVVGDARVVAIGHGELLVLRNGREEVIRAQQALGEPPDTRHAIRRSEVVTAIDRMVAMPAGLHLVPAFRAGLPFGFKLIRVPRDSLLTQVGLQTGDTVIAINGRPLNSVSVALELYAQLGQLDAVSVTVERDNVPLTLAYRVQ